MQKHFQIKKLAIPIDHHSPLLPLNLTYMIDMNHLHQSSALVDQFVLLLFNQHLFNPFYLSASF